MRQTLLTSVSVLVIALSASAALAGPHAPQAATARAEASLLPPPAAVTASKTAGEPAAVDLRDSAALVLVGGMLIGLAAAVRRTA